MKRILRTSLAFLLTFTLILGSFSGLAFGATASSPGENSWWDYRAESFSDFNGSTATLTIHTPQELALFSYICSNPTDYYWPYQTVKLGSNISLYGHQWEPIHTGRTFTFDGNGYAIYGMTITGTPEITIGDYGMVNTIFLGLFGNGRGVTIQNLNMRNVKIDIDLPADGYLSGYVLECGAIAGWAADVINCFAQVDMNFDTGYEIGVAGIVADANIVKDCVTRGTLTVNAAGGFVAGVAGEVNSCQKCTNYASINASGLNVGGVFGIGGYASYSESPAATGCKNYGDIVISGTNRYVGGVGYMVEFGKVSLCHNIGTIGNVSSSDYLTAGGIVGMTKSDNSIVISDCKSHGAITLIGDQTYAGGVVGHLNEGFWASDSEEAFLSGCAQVTSCESASVIDAGYVGGIAATNDGYIYSCRMSGNLVGKCAGGIAYRNNGMIESCDNNSNLEAEERIGGIAAENYGKISACRNFREVSGDRMAGGIVGQNWGMIQGSANYGTVCGSAESTIGGIVGQFDGYVDRWNMAPFAWPSVIENCENGGVVDGTGATDSPYGNVGGIVGSMGADSGDGILQDCLNTGSVTGINMASGIVGTAWAESFWTEDPSAPIPSAYILRCENQGSVYSNQTSAGIVANINSWSTEDCSGIIIEDVYNRGSVVTAGADIAYSSAAAGGIIGTAHDEGGKITIRNAFHMGSLSCNTRNMGAIAGSAYNVDLSDDLYYQKMQGLDGVGGGYMFDAETGYGWEYDESLMVGLTRSQLADPASFKGFDFDEVWIMSMGHPVLQGCGLEGAVIPSKGYYVALTDKFFRISDPTVGYPQPNDFTLSVGNMDFRTGALRELGIPVDLAEGVNVVVSKDGYHTYTLPQELITSYNVITMTPSSVTGPFAESLLLDKSSGSYKGYTNLRADGESVYESDLSHRDSQRIYVSVNWNGHGDGFVWLEQDGEKLNLLDGSFTPVEIGSVFTAGPSIYLCGEAEDGTTFRHSTKLSVLARHVTDGIDMGIEESLTVDGSLDDNLGFLDSQSFALNFSALSGGAVPLKVKIDGETIKGTIGVSAGKEEYEKKSDGSSKHEQDNMFDMVKEFVDLYKKGSGPDGETLLELQLDKKLKELKKATEIGAVPSSTGVEGEIQVLGYFVGSIVNGEPVLSECSIVLLFEGKVYHVAPFVLGTYPGYLKTELGAALEVILADWKYDRATRKLKKTEPVTINTDIDLSIEAALGWEGIFSGGVKGHGQVHVGFTVPSVKNSTKLSLQGDIALVGNLLGIPGEWVIVRSKEMIFYQNGAWCWTSAAKSYSLRNTVALMAADPEVAASLFDAEDDRVWRSDIFTGGQAAMTILADGTRILVWQESLENHDDGALFYSVEKNGQWSEPIQLDEDATSDFAPVLKNVNGNVYLLWSDLNADLDTSEDLLEIASATDLSVAKFNGTTFDLLGSSVGEDSALDQNPDIQEVLGTPVLTWTSTPVTEGVLGEASVKYASFDGENWTAYEEGADLSWDQASASEDLPDVGTTFTVLNLGVETAVVYAQDGIVYGLFNDGGGWGSPMILEELPTDAVVYSLSADRDDQGDIVIALTCGGVASSAEGTVFGQTDLLLLEVSMTEDLVVTSAGYAAQELVPGREMTMWVDVENNTRSTLRQASIKIQGGGNTVQLTAGADIPSGQSGMVSFAFALPENAGNIADSYSITLTSEDVSESSLTNNKVTCAINKADASVEGFSAMAAGENGEASVWIANRGLTDLSDITVSLYGLSDPDTVLASGTIDALAVGSAAAYTFTDVNFGEETLVGVRVSQADAENIEYNNSSLMALERIPYDELTAMVYGLSQEGSSVTARFSISNSYSSDQTITLALALYDTNGRMTDVKYLTGYTVPAGQEKQGQLTFIGGKNSSAVKMFIMDTDGSLQPLEMSAEAFF